MFIYYIHGKLFSIKNILAKHLKKIKMSYFLPNFYRKIVL